MAANPVEPDGSDPDILSRLESEESVVIEGDVLLTEAQEDATEVFPVRESLGPDDADATIAMRAIQLPDEDAQG